MARALGGDLAEIDDDNDGEIIKKLIENAGRTSAWIGPDENASLDLDGHGGNAPRGYVVEFPPTPSFATVNADADPRTVRILVVRARYKNQDTEKVDGLKGNFSPITSDDLHRQMNATRTFYLRESNGKCRIDYNASGTVTLPEDNEFYNWIAGNEGRGAAFG